ncbi:MAG: hypothetical protein V1914_02970 [archaeon]
MEKTICCTGKRRSLDLLGILRKSLRNLVNLKSLYFTFWKTVHIKEFQRNRTNIKCFTLKKKEQFVSYM